MDFFGLYSKNYKEFLLFIFSVSGDCSHVLAVLMTLEDWILQGLKDVPDQPACTSMPQQWDKPRGAKIEAEPVTTMVIAKPGTINRKRKPLTANFDDNRYVYGPCQLFFQCTCTCTCQIADRQFKKYHSNMYLMFSNFCVINEALHDKINKIMCALRRIRLTWVYPPSFIKAVAVRMKKPVAPS